LNKRSNEKEEVKEEEIINSKSGSSKIEKFENEKKESRGGGFKSFSEILETKKRRVEAGSQMTPNRLSEDLEISNPLLKDRKSVREKSPPKIASQGTTGQSKLEAVMVKISQDIGDTKHSRENRKQAKNILTELEKRGVTEDQFIDTLFNVKGLTVEVIESLDSPGAYFFSVLRDRWKISN
jgi:hypothetical protein